MEILEIFNFGIKILMMLTSIFFVVFFFLCAYWAKPAHPERHIKIGFLVATFYTFLFIFVGFLVLIIITFSIEYIPTFIKSQSF